MAVCGSMRSRLFVAPCVCGVDDDDFDDDGDNVDHYDDDDDISAAAASSSSSIMCTAALSRCSRGAGFGARPRVALLRLR